MPVVDFLLFDLDDFFAAIMLLPSEMGAFLEALDAFLLAPLPAEAGALSRLPLLRGASSEA